MIFVVHSSESSQINNWKHKTFNENYHQFRYIHLFREYRGVQQRQKHQANHQHLHFIRHQAMKNMFCETNNSFFKNITNGRKYVPW